MAMAEAAGQKTVIVGAGPVGTLAALYAAKRGHQVAVYELRGDPRDPQTVPLNFTKSINLALSERGINSMRQAQYPGLLDTILDETIPMHARMIHGSKDDQLYEESQTYDAHGRFIRAADRATLNKRLLDELDRLPNVIFFFNHKLAGVDFKRRIAWFERRQGLPRTDDPQNPTQSDESNIQAEEIEVSFDFMIGADGAHSAVRYHLMKYARMSYSQHYIDTLWCEFHIAPSNTNDFKISPNHLHIWPNSNSMFIAIPSQDKSFTSTLFLPAAEFARIDSDPSSLVSFFNKAFPGVAGRLISESDLCKQYNENPHLPLISIKCEPHHFAASAVILGDAAHAMVPFYGQGMNAGLEDVRVLFDVLDAHPATPTGRAAALDTYSAQRTPDAHAINDLALRNYQEMSHDVTSPVYHMRKWIEEELNVWFPRLGFATQYSRISFGNMRYSDVHRLAEKQGRVLLCGMAGAVGLLVPVMAYGTWLVWRRNRASDGGDGFTRLWWELRSLGDRIVHAFA